MRARPLSAESRGFPKLPYSRESRGYARLHSRNNEKGTPPPGCSRAIRGRAKPAPRRATRPRKTDLKYFRTCAVPRAGTRRKKTKMSNCTHVLPWKALRWRTYSPRRREREATREKRRRETGVARSRQLFGEERRRASRTCRAKRKRNAEGKNEERDEAEGNRGEEREALSLSLFFPLSAHAARSKVVFETRGGNEIAGDEDAARLALVPSEFFFFISSFSLSLSLSLSLSTFLFLVLSPFVPPLALLVFIFTRSDYPGEKCRGNGRGGKERGEGGRGRGRARGKKNRVALALFAHGTSCSSERYTSMVHMDLEMFAGRAVQILIKRNIFRMREPTGAGETNRRVPFLISCQRARKNAPDDQCLDDSPSISSTAPRVFLISLTRRYRATAWLIRRCTMAQISTTQSNCMCHIFHNFEILSIP